MLEICSFTLCVAPGVQSEPVFWGQGPSDVRIQRHVEMPPRTWTERLLSQNKPGLLDVPLQDDNMFIGIRLMNFETKEPQGHTNASDCAKFPNTMPA